MALPTISVLNSDGTAVTVNTLGVGRAADASSASVALSTEDVTILSAISTALSGTLTVGTHAVTNITGTVTLPTGAATAAKQPALGSAGAPSADVISVQGVAGGAPQPVNTESTKATFSAGTNGQSLGSSPNDLVIIKGSSTKTIKIRKVMISAEATTAGSMRFFLLRRSTAPSGGTASSITPAQHDSASAAASAAVTFYTAAPTAGTLLATIAGTRLPFPPAGTYEPVTFDFSNFPIVLRGTSEFLTLTVTGTTPTGGVFDFHIEWTEE